MAIPTNIRQLEYDKFMDDGFGNVAVRVVVVTASSLPNLGMPVSVQQMEYNKFYEDDSGDTAILFI